MIEPVSNAYLRVERLPEYGDIDAILHFALTYNGYEESGGFEECADAANRASERFEVGAGLPGTLSELRGCLFFEQRRWHHFGESRSPEARTYLSALMEAIRQKVAAADIA